MPRAAVQVNELSYFPGALYQHVSRDLETRDLFKLGVFTDLKLIAKKSLNCPGTVFTWRQTDTVNDYKVYRNALGPIAEVG